MPFLARVAVFRMVWLGRGSKPKGDLFQCVLANVGQCLLVLSVGRCVVDRMFKSYF